MTTTEQRPGKPSATDSPADDAAARPSPRGVQSVKFSFYRVHDDVRAAPEAERRALAGELRCSPAPTPPSAPAPTRTS
ncbi:MAG: hypothetical protein O2895_01230 [Chloroflexi bacterium]|nr:hypothetical protein [Chloroflexota bacterium]